MKTNTLFGVLAIDKPAGRTSRDVCNRIERLVRPDKVGHTGTLDPLATGVLLLAIGSASRLVEFSLGHSKEYEADFELGVRSETLDIDSTQHPIESAPVPSRGEIEAEMAKWIGSVEQVPPKYSAINISGRRAYDLARKGKKFQLSPREINIYAIEILAYNYPHLTLRIECGSGTYVRSLGSDIAVGLGSDAVMSRLVRTRIGPYKLSDCALLDAFQSQADVAARLRPPHQLIADLSVIVLSADQCSSIRHGVPLQLNEQVNEKIVAVDALDNLVAVLTRTETPGCYRSVRVFHEMSETSQPKMMSRPHSPES